MRISRKCRGILTAVSALMSGAAAVGSLTTLATAQPAPPAVAEAADQADSRLATILEGHAADVGRLETRVRAARGKLLTETIDRLQKLQDEHCRAARLDAALAVREAIRGLQREADVVAASPAQPSTAAPPGPDSLTRLATKIGDTYLFTITGANRGSIWGTDVYTLDSNLAVAAVHAGALAVGETGAVKVTIVDSPAEHVGSHRHGITTGSWPRYRMSFRVERVGAVPAVTVPGVALPAAAVGAGAQAPPGARPTAPALPNFPAIPLTPAIPRVPARPLSPSEHAPPPPTAAEPIPAEAEPSPPATSEPAAPRRPFG